MAILTCNIPEIIIQEMDGVGFSRNGFGSNGPASVGRIIEICDIRHAGGDPAGIAQTGNIAQAPGIDGIGEMAIKINPVSNLGMNYRFQTNKKNKYQE